MASPLDRIHSSLVFFSASPIGAPSVMLGTLQDLSKGAHGGRGAHNRGRFIAPRRGLYGEMLVAIIRPGSPRPADGSSLPNWLDFIFAHIAWQRQMGTSNNWLSRSAVQIVVG